ncbi:hypothetical protein MUN53_08125 [Parabacteroides sp. AGMB00274]|uniref:Alpha-L-rhamnosidase six-hairpin glycosidase domain-containing protein n=1 Tax=Parabacteroides faecalis TaxID=2924040 RepID=A0ABT0C0Q1_9BACT|nr:hypothetical protein [Parabacteroides faecalis]MCI7287396.1 hypothetical protein [Parabacteroides sp.]MCJ2380574.1 hypothetical protein [Parabacteroides faecalis]MDY6254877.1 hypothetical protein [Bacteroidales bacterium]
MKKVVLFICLVFSYSVGIYAQQRWYLNQDGGISWEVKSGDNAHSDHIEMSGLKVSTVVRYGVDDEGNFLLNRGMVWPMLRTIPNDTHASLMRKLGWNPLENVLINNAQIKEQVRRISLDGTMEVESDLSTRQGVVGLTRILFPSIAQPMFCEKYVLENKGNKAVTVEINQVKNVMTTAAEKGVNGSYRIIQALNGAAYTSLQPGQSVSFYVYTVGYEQGEPEVIPDIERELSKRQAFIQELWGKLVLNTPDPVINTMFAFAKIRGAESIYDTACGLLHGPGGESYYAAIWANDQAEYINPFFPFLGYDKGNQSALNAYLQFARFMNDAYKPLPSSIIAEGADVWGGAGDRGDAAMIAYGASRYALERGSKEEAEQLWPLIEWCLEYCHRKVNADGVVASDSDELEGRFPAGDANLCTSSLYYDALNSAVYLGKELKKEGKLLKQYTSQAKSLKANIEKYFGAEVEGFQTYQYYKGNDVLRSWICIPLTVNIFDRKEETVRALFSPRLWTENGLLTQAGSETFWDRSTLYALRGVYACGETEKATEYLKFYSGQRLLGEHIPYAIEAWPEGNQRHLSAESGLYCRIITEGMFGIRPTGFKSFVLTPRLPAEWNQMSLHKIQAFGSSFDVEIQRAGEKLQITVLNQGKVCMKKTIKEGDSLMVKL